MTTITVTDPLASLLREGCVIFTKKDFSMLRLGIKNATMDEELRHDLLTLPVIGVGLGEKYDLVDK